MMNKWKQERGAVQIVEASFVFPVMFIILFFLIYMGNAFYVKAQVESVVESNALRGASYAVDPVLKSIRDSHSVPTVDAVEIQPYRYIIGGMGNVESDIGNAVKKEIKEGSATFFGNMKPKLLNSGKVADYSSKVIYATFAVEVKYALEFPIRFLGRSTPNILTITSRAEVPVNDAPEFIRNTDMAVDLLQDTKIGKTIGDLFSKVSGFISKMADK